MLGKDYLNSRWTAQLHRTERIHIIYLAVRPDMQHHGLAALLLGEVIRYADQHKLMISLETHNPDKVPQMCIRDRSGGQDIFGECRHPAIRSRNRRVI